MASTSAGKEQEPSALPSMILAERPGYGTSGEKVVVKSNHFKVKFTPKIVYHYDVSITPEGPKGMNREIIRSLIEQYGDRFKNILAVYDGQKSIYTAHQLSDTIELDVDLKPETGGNPSAGKRSGRKFHVVIREASRPDLSALADYLSGKTRVLPQETLQVLDVVLREAATKTLVAGGRSYFGDVLGCKDLGGGMVAWQGFYQSIRPAQNGLLTLNLDITANAFLDVQYLPDYLGHSLSINPGQLNSEFSKQDARGDALRARVKKLLKGLKVETTHTQSTRRYRIANITSEPVHVLMFDMNGEQVSVLDYFRKTYNYTMKLPGYPALDCGTKDRKRYIPMEVCRIIKGQNCTRRINDSQRSRLSAITCCKPKERMQYTKKIVQGLVSQSAKYTDEFGVKINYLLTEIPARVLQPPRIKYGNDAVNPRNGSWNMIGKKMLRGCRIGYWAIISFSPAFGDNEMEQLRGDFVQNCQTYGIEINPKPACPYLVERSGDVQGALTKVYNAIFQRNNKQTPQLFLCIMPSSSNNKSVYLKVKRVSEIELGVVTQCCKEENLKRRKPTYLANLLLKINAKMGGQNSWLADEAIRKVPLLSNSSTMIIGADVSHPRVGDDFSVSVAAVVASMERGFSEYEAIVRSQESRQEILQGLFWEKEDESGHKITGGILKDLLQSYEQRTKSKPDRIIYYRDGVSEGQFDTVLRQELEALRRACDAVGWGSSQGGTSSLEPSQKRVRVPSTGPKLTFIVVQKRHHTCFFDARETDDNIRPGTVVDREICQPSHFDFFLCSHQGIKGTSRPAHYYVLKDESGFSADDIQAFTNNLCYMYARCTRAVSYVPACYYAHLAAKRGREWVESEGSSHSGSVYERSSIGSGGNFKSAPPAGPLPEIHKNIKKSMYFL